MIGEFLSGRGIALGGGVDQAVGIGGFTAYAKVFEGVDLDSTLPEAIREDGSPAHDHIVNQPIKIRIAGVVADTHITVGNAFTGFGALDNIAGAVSAIAPGFSGRMLDNIGRVGRQMQDVYNRVDSAVSQAAGGLAALGIGGDALSEFASGNAAKFLQFMKSIREARMPVTVQTTYDTYEDMAIEAFGIQTDNKNDWLTFDLRMKQIATASLIMAEVQSLAQSPSPAAKSTVAGVDDKGAQKATAPEKKQTSLLGSIMGR